MSWSLERLIRIVRALLAIGLFQGLAQTRHLHTTGTHSVVPDQQLKVLHRRQLPILEDRGLGRRVPQQVLDGCSWRQSRSGPAGGAVGGAYRVDGSGCFHDGGTRPADAPERQSRQMRPGPASYLFELCGHGLRGRLQREMNFFCCPHDAGAAEKESRFATGLSYRTPLLSPPLMYPYNAVHALRRLEPLHAQCTPRRAGRCAVPVCVDSCRAEPQPTQPPQQRFLFLHAAQQRVGTRNFGGSLNRKARARSHCSLSHHHHRLSTL